MSTPPYSANAESSVIGQLLNDSTGVAELAAMRLERDHFYLPAHKLLFDAIVEAHYADDPTDPLSIAAQLTKQLAAIWGVADQDVATLVDDMATQAALRRVAIADHAKVVRRQSDFRRLKKLATRLAGAVDEEAHEPDALAALVSSEAMAIATASGAWKPPTSMLDAGRAFIKQTDMEVAAREQGIETGAYFGIQAIDAYTHSLRPTELLIAGGEPGVGKSAVWWRAGMNFAERQSKHPKDRRIGCLIVSLEMGEHPSNIRLAQSLTGIDSAVFREARVKPEHRRRVIDEWRRWDVPLYFDYSPSLRCSQLRALIADSIRRYNVGVVIVDHFRMFDLDSRPAQMRGDEVDEEKARFLKEQIAQDLNVAVVCLAHTRKKDSGSLDPRPRLSDLRGSGQIAAHSDFVCFLHRPWQYASQRERDSGDIAATDAEVIWAKNRHGHDEIAKLYFDPARMKAV